jgi:geranylgeranyl diphosphate synthase type I
MTTMLDPVLHRSRDVVEPALRRAVARLDPDSALLAAYHLGWVEADGTPRRSGGGKALRPALALLAARACGASEEAAIPAAVAAELVHNFSLLHDDVMDGDVERRHRPTVWVIWGSSRAILAGDALMTLASEVLLESGSPYAGAMTRLLLRATRELIGGQMADLDFESRSAVGLDECLAMVAGKTGALMAASTGLGAVSAGAAPAVETSLTRYGERLGTAFQLVDDLLGIWGTPAETGKPVLSDLRTRKKSLPVCFALAQTGPAADELADWMRTPPARRGQPALDDEEPALRRAAELVEDCGGRKWAVAEARRQVDAAHDALAAVALDPTAAEELDALAEFVVSRDY